MESSANNNLPTQEQLAYYLALILDNQTLGSIINSATDKNGEVPENFICHICHQLVYQPSECNNCDHIYCQACISDWLSKGKRECPLCREQITPQPMNRLVRKFLEETVLRGCPVEGCER